MAKNNLTTTRNALCRSIYHSAHEPGNLTTTTFCILKTLLPRNVTLPFDHLFFIPGARRLSPARGREPLQLFRRHPAPRGLQERPSRVRTGPAMRG